MAVWTVARRCYDQLDLPAGLVFSRIPMVTMGPSQLAPAARWRGRHGGVGSGLDAVAQRACPGQRPASAASSALCPRSALVVGSLQHPAEPPFRPLPTPPCRWRQLRWTHTYVVTRNCELELYVNINRLGYQRWVGTSWQVVAPVSDFPGATPLPSGLAISADGQRLFVSDAASQAIIAFAVTAPPRTPQPSTGEFAGTAFQKIGTIETPATQIQGLAYMYDADSERLFYTDAKANRIVVVNPDCPGSGHTTDSSGTCVCPDGSSQAGCSAPMDPFDPTKVTLYSGFGRGKNFDGCARQFFDKCPGGNPTVPGHFALAPCYNLGLEACEPETGVCRCANGAEASCTDTADSGTCSCPAADVGMAGAPAGPAGAGGARPSMGLSVLAVLPGWLALGIVLTWLCGSKAEANPHGKHQALSSVV